jgi:predicted DNA binding CopG/RHH family protein
MKLTKEEQEILDSVERGEWKRIDNFEQEKARYQAIAAETLRKDKRVTVRMTERELRKFQIKAAEEGIPCQTLMYSVLHKYINGTSKA